MSMEVNHFCLVVDLILCECVSVCVLQFSDVPQIFSLFDEYKTGGACIVLQCLFLLHSLK